MEKNPLMVAMFGEEVQYYPYLWKRVEETEEIGRETKTIFEKAIPNRVVKVTVEDAIQQALEDLNEKERKILTLYFGLKGETPRSQKELAREFRVTGSRIGQIIKKAIRKLYLPSRSQYLREYLVPTPEQRFKEKLEVADLKEELRKERAGKELAQKTDEDALKMAINTVTANYQERYGDAPLCGRVRNALRRAGITRLSQLKMLDRKDLYSLKNIGKQSLDFIQEVLQTAEQNKASP